MLKFNFALIILLAVIFNSQAQDANVVVIEKSDSIVQHKGEAYYVHFVEQGHTLFSIAKAYDVFLSQVVFANPGAMDGIEPGQVLLIPKDGLAPTKREPAPMPVDGDHILYTVPGKMTLYSISKEFDVEILDLVDSNPALKDGLKKGMILRIPVMGIMDGAVGNTVELTGLPQLIAAAVRDTGDPISILLFAPFYLDQNDTIQAHLKEGESEEVFKRSVIGIQFYEGLLLALDSLTRRGIRFNVKVVDTDRSLTKVEHYINNRSLKRPDVIIGPFYRQLLKPVARFAYRNCIPIITPTVRDLKELGYNDHILQVVPALKNTTQALGSFVSSLPDTANFILAHYGRPEEAQLQIDFRKGLEANGTDSLPDFEVVDLEAGTYDNVKRLLVTDKPNHIVVLTNNEASVSKLMRTMIGWLEDYEIILYSPENWAKFKNIDVEYFDQLRHHRPEPTFIEFDSVNVVQFNVDFREHFETEPGSFAFRGYDIGLQFIPNMVQIREGGLAELTDIPLSVGLQQSFLWKQNKRGNWVNVSAFVLRLNDLQLEVAE